MNWEILKIKDLGKIITGKTPCTNNRSFFDGEFQFVTPTDITFDNYYCRKTETTVTEAAKQKHRNQFIPPDSIMVTCIGSTIGKCALSSKECLTNQQINSIVPFDIYNPKYVYYLMIFNIEIIRGIGLSGGVAAPIINKAAFERIKIKLPSKESRDKIATILSAYDDLIDINRRRIRLLEEAARLLFREWFVYFRFPGHEKIKIVDGMPEGWEKGSVKDIAKVKSGYAFDSKDWLDEGNPVIKIGNIIGDGTVNLDDCSYIDQNVASKAKDFVLKKGDLLIAMTGATVGKVGLLSENEKIAYLNQRVGKFIPQFEGAELILYCFFMSDTAQNHITNYAGGAAQANISASQIKSIKIVVAPQDIYNQFIGLIKSTFEQILNLRNQNKKLAQARDLLLPRLMSGKIEV
ncbi:MAG: restriction endonuclease subunit S [Candidatus Brocadia sp.]|nr:restriction endonuclease subunit S [Candidatus Brocadia sp.]